MASAMEEISSKDARDNMSDILNRVAYQGAHFLLTRHGKGEAVIIPFEEWDLLDRLRQELEDKEDIRDSDAAMERIQKGEKTIPLEEMKRKLGL